MKSRILLPTLLLLFFAQNLFSQSNYLYREIQSLKESKNVFQRVNAFQTVQKTQRVLSNFKNKDNVEFFRFLPENMKGKGNALQIALPDKTKTVLELIEVSDVFDYEVVTDKGDVHKPNKNIKHYRGIVKDDKESMVTLTVFENQVMGIITTNKQTHNIAYDKQSGNHIMYDDKNLVKPKTFQCSTVDDMSIGYSSDVLFNNNQISSKSLTTHLKYARLYLETEYDIYQAYGNSMLAVEAFITGLYFQVATLYRNEGIFTTLSQIFIWTAEDPYTENNTQDLLNKFQSTRTSINGDLGQLLTFRSVGGGRAVVDGLCHSKTRNKLGVSGIDNNYTNAPNYSWSVFVMSHEFGHLFGSKHTHACVWNGNNTAIDGCESTEGGCLLPPLPLLTGGTIMSYCHNTRAGINFNLGFGPQPGNLIRNKVNNASCLPTYAVNFTGPDQIGSQNTYTYTLQNLPPSAVVTWSFSNNSMTLVSGQGTATATFKQTGFEDGEIRAAISPFTIFTFPVNIIKPSISGSSSLCTQQTYTLNNLPNGVSVYWMVHPELSIVNQTINSITVQKQPFSPLLSNAWITADIEEQTNLNVYTASRYNMVIWQSGIIETNSLITAGGGLNTWGGEVEIPLEFLNAGAYDVTWKASNGWTATLQNTNFTQFFGPSFSGEVIISVDFKTPCGHLTSLYRRFYIAPNEYFSIAPNPSSTFINISPSTEAATARTTQTKTEQPTFDRVVISDAMGNMQLQQNVRATSAYRVDVSRLKNGIYYLNLYSNGKLIEKKTIQIAK